MKFLIFFVATCMLAGFNADDAATDDSAAPTLESITDEASSMFSDFLSKVLSVDIDIANNDVYAKYLAVKDKLDSIAAKLTNDVTAAKADALNQVDQIKSTAYRYSDSAIDVCSFSANVDVTVYVDSQLDSGIQSNLESNQNILNQLNSKVTELLDTSYLPIIYSQIVDSKDATVESIQSYIDQLRILLSAYPSWAKAKAAQAVALFDDLAAQSENHAEDKSQYLQAILSNVVPHFQACLDNSDRL